jgi:hypothetical protein
MRFLVFLGSKMAPKINKSLYLFALLEIHFLEVDFGMFFDRLGLDVGRSDPQSARHGAVEMHVGPFSNSWKSIKNVQKLIQK